MATEHQEKIQLLLNLLQGVKKKKYRRKGPWKKGKSVANKIKLKCNNCSKVYYLWPSQYKQRIKKRNNPSVLCCSVKCKSEYDSIQNRDMKKWGLGTCYNIFCQKKFYYLRSGGLRKYCSKDCANYAITNEYQLKLDIQTRAKKEYEKKTNANLFKR